MEISPKEATKTVIDSALLLSIIPALIYLCAYYFEHSYMAYFNLPLTLVNIDISVILTFGVVALGDFLALIFPVIIIITFIEKYRKKKFGLFKAFLICVIFTLLFLEVANITLDNRTWLIYLITWLTFIILAIIMKLIHHILPKFYPTKKKSKNFDSDIVIIDNRTPLFNAIFPHEFKNIHYLVFAIILLPIISGSYGSYKAATSNNFAIIGKSAPKIVIAKFGGEIICRDYNFSENVIGDSIFIVKVSDNSILKFFNLNKDVDVSPLIKQSWGSIPFFWRSQLRTIHKQKTSGLAPRDSLKLIKKLKTDTTSIEK